MQIQPKLTAVVAEAVVVITAEGEEAMAEVVMAAEDRMAGATGVVVTGMADTMEAVTGVEDITAGRITTTLLTMVMTPRIA